MVVSWRARWRSAVIIAAVALAAVATVTVRPPGAAQAGPPPVTGDARVDALLARMTTAEKFAMLSGRAEVTNSSRQYQAGLLGGVARLGIPSLKLADGPPGVATKQQSTGMTATMGVAATFDYADAQANGEVIGADGRALGQDVVLEPYVNIDRDTAYRRAFNTFGEDPLLTAQMGAAEIRGIQSQGVMAMVKHYLGFDGANNVTVDPQTLHEIYLKPFETAVRNHVASVMCSYNVINDAQACGNSVLLTGVLRGELGFTGYVTSDWGANHATSYLADGLDMEMPGSGGAPGGGDPQYFTAAALAAALKNGTITTDQVNEAVGRILVEYDRFGLLTGKSKHTVTPLPTTADEATVLHTARDSATLLQNAASTLPLDADALHSLTVIGPGGGQVIATDGGGEKSGGLVSQQEGPVAALHREAPTAKINYQVGDDLTGIPLSARVLSYRGKPGLLRTTGSKHQIDRQINFTRANKHALAAGRAVSWKGTLTIGSAGTYWLDMQTLGAVTNLTIDGKSRVTTAGGNQRKARYGTVHPSDGNTPVPTTDGLANGRAVVTLTKGTHSLSVSTVPDASGQPIQVRLNVQTPYERAAHMAAAVAAAKQSHTAVVFAWADGTTDLSKPLPDGQDALIDAVAKANPNTVVVLNTGQPIAMPWLASVKAVLQMWYPGDKGGQATADVLLGRTNPGGHLPFTWPATLDQEVAHQTAHPERNSYGLSPTTGLPCGAPARNDPTCKTTYSEGIDVGYRYYAATGETPLYPFGYGLSYGSLTYHDLTVSRRDNGAVDATFDVTNSGTQAADAAPQAYLGPPDAPPSGTQFAPTALAGFTRVRVAPGETVTVTLSLSRRTQQYWSTADNAWETATGTRPLYIGTDAATPALQTSIDVS